MKPFLSNHPVTFSYLRRYSNGNPHKGVDYGTPWRTPLVSAVNGKVWYAGFGGGWGSAYGGQVIIEFTHNGATRYLLTAHMNEITVKTGQKVTMGQPIGRSGGRPGTKGAGNTTGAHVHVQVNKSKTWSDHINPQFAMDLGKAPTATKPTLSPINKKMFFELQQDLNVRDFPHTSFGKVLTTLPKNTVVEVAREDKVDGQWWDELKGGGWLAQDYMLATGNPAHKAEAGTYVCIVDLANLREQPYAGSRDIGDLVKGREFKAVGADIGYDDGQLWLVDNQHHWVRADLVAPKTEAGAANPPVVEPTDPVALTILPRRDWTSTPDNRHDKLSVAKVTALTCHYPADGDVTYASLTKAQVAQKLEQYRKHHTAKGWKDIGYNYAIDQAGRCWFLTGDDIGAHANTVGNTTSIGVLWVIGNNEVPSAAAIATFKQLLALKRKTFTKITKVQGHQQVPGNSTACPGPQLMKLIKDGALDVGNDKPTVPPVVVVPTPEVPEVTGPEQLGLRVGSLNVIGRRLTSRGASYTTEGGLPIKDVQKGRDYATRVPLLAKKNDLMRVSILGTQESGTYAMGDALSKKLGFENVLHGDNGDLTNAVHWDPAKRRMLKEGVFTVPGRDHKFVTWAMLEDIQSKRDILSASFHADHRKNDATLKAQAESFAKQLKALSGGTRVIIAMTDANESRDEPHDAFGKAMKAAGFIETEVVAKVKHSAEFTTTLPSTSTTPRKGKRHIDRIWVWCPPGCTVEVLEWGIAVELTPATKKIPQPIASDHWGVYASLLFTYK